MSKGKGKKLDANRGKHRENVHEKTILQRIQDSRGGEEGWWLGSKALKREKEGS